MRLFGDALGCLGTDFTSTFETEKLPSCALGFNHAVGEQREAVTWVQLGIQNKPCLLANLAGYYDPLVAQFDRGLASGFISPQNREIVRVVTSLDSLLTIISRNTTTERILP